MAGEEQEARTQLRVNFFLENEKKEGKKVEHFGQLAEFALKRKRRRKMENEKCS